MKSSSQLRQFLFYSCLFFLTIPALAAHTGEDSAEVFSEEIENILSMKASELGLFLQNTEILNSVRASNLEHKDLTLDEILSLDKKFRATEITDAWIQSFTTNACAGILIRYQKEHPGFSEIFIADVKGLNVGQTNKTSDYYQADEDWWVKTYQNGDGKVHHGDIEFDESAQSQSVALYLPVMDGQPSRAIGVVKAVLDIDQIKEKL